MRPACVAKKQSYSAATSVATSPSWTRCAACEASRRSWRRLNRRIRDASLAKQWKLPRGPSGGVGEQLSRMCTDIVARALPVVVDRLTAHIDERLAHLESRQRVNLNVRAPKRAAPHQPQIARDLAAVGRPVPLAKFLDQKERDDPTWTCARRSFAPAFGMTVQVLKKKKLREEGKVAIYIEQNHRPQLLYTEEDRELMEEAWRLTTAHREDLAGRPGNPQEEALVVQNRRTVMDMLRGRE